MTSELPPIPPPEPIPQGPKPVVAARPADAPIPLPPVALRTAEQSSRSNRRWIIGGSIAGGLLVIGVLVGATAIVVSLAGQFRHPAVQAPVAGAPGATAPTDPVVCPEKCFFEAPRSLVPPQDAFDQLGLTTVDQPYGAYADTTALAIYDDAVTQWNDYGGTPDSCFVVYEFAPVAYPLGSRPDAPGDGQITEAITFAGSHRARFSQSILTQDIRLFATSQAASDHLATLDGLLQQCHSYTAHTPNGNWNATVSRAPALDLPGSVASVGWVETAAQGRYYVYDLQRSNLVIRSYLYTEGSITEQQFRSFENDLAHRLDKLQINVSNAYVPPSGCTGACLTTDQAALLTPSATTLGAGLPSTGAAPTSTLGPLWNTASAIYATGKGDPYACFFTLSTAPVNITEPYDERNDPVLDLGTYGDGTTTLRELAHVYTAEIYAGRYIRTLTSPIKQCAQFSYADADGRMHQAALTPQTFDTGSSDVESIAWQQVADGVTTTVVDLRYRNITMRITIDQQAGSPVTREQIARHVLEVSAQLQALG